MDRRKFIYQTVLTTGSIATMPFLNLGISSTKDSQPFTLPDLPYAYNSLEPFIDEQTMLIHHGKHFQGYTNNLNKAIENTRFANSSITDILSKVSSSETAIRNNGGGYYNHTLYFESLSPRPKSKPEGELMEAIKRDFGSYEEFVEDFSQAATTVFGSGWSWLIKNKKGQLAITSTPNQDNPLMPFSTNLGQPLMGIDVWEHAYYLKYQNKRSDYIDAYFKVLDWQYVENRFNR